jgi:adenylate kinase family enzyme
MAVFGNTGGGKSALAKRLEGLTSLPLYPLDLIQYRVGGGKVPEEECLKAHADLLRKDEWIIDGYGSAASAWERFAVADTLVYVDLPLFTHYWWVTKRLIESLLIIPEGWPERSPCGAAPSTARRWPGFAIAG